MEWLSGFAITEEHRGYEGGNVEDQAERETFWTSSPTACAFEPLTRRRFERPSLVEDCGAEAPDGGNSEERVGRQPSPRTTELMAQILNRLN